MRTLKDILLEALSPKEIRQKYYNDIDKKTFERIAKADPTSRYEDGKLTKVGAFVKFIIKDYKRGIFKFEDAPRYKEYIGLYIKNRNRKELRGFDILKIDGIHELIDKLQFLKAEESGEIDELLKMLTEGVDYREVLNGEKWRVFQPLSEKGACTLGFTTEWCTAWGPKSMDKSKRGRQNLFNSYKDNLFTLYSKETQKPVWQIHLQTNQFMDVNDTNLVDRPVGGYDDVPDFFSKNKEVLLAMYPQLKELDNPSKNMLMDVAHLTKYLPNSINKKLIEAYSSFLPTEIVEKLDYLYNNWSADEEKSKSILSELFYDAECEGLDRYGVELVVERSSEMRDLIRHADTARHYVDYSESVYDDDDLNHYIDETLKKILNNPNSDGYKLLKQVMLPFRTNNFNHEDLKRLVGEKNYKKIKDATEESIQGAEYDGRVQATQTVSDKISDVWSVDNYDNIKFNGLLLFINFMKEFLVYQNYEEGDEYDFESFFTFVNDRRGAPSDLESFYYDISDNSTMDVESVYNSVEVSIEEVLDDFKDDADRLASEEFQRIVNDLNIDNNGVMENEISKIKIFPDTIDYDNRTIKIEFTDKQNPEKSYIGTVPFSEIGTYAKNYKLFEEMVRMKKMMVI